MTNRKSTKRALLGSVMAMVLCLAMLVGATFAWFTDTASTGVNKIQAGNLNIELQYATKWDANGVPTKWENAEGKTLPFLVNGGIPAEGTQILWEPGCTYMLPELRVVNKGNLAVKFEYVPEALGVTGKLADVLELVFEAPDDNIEPEVLLPGETSPAWSFGYHMDEAAGNDYQNATAAGAYVTVVATQVASEYDSFNNTYDENAAYPVVSAAGLQDAMTNGGVVALAEDVALVPEVADTTERTLVPQMTMTKDTTLDLSGKKLAVDASAANADYGKASPLMLAVMGGTLTVTGDGELNCEAGNNQVYGINVNGGKVVIESGKFYGAMTAIQVQKGSLEIKGGFFDMAPTCKAAVPQYAKYVVNCIDAAYKDGTATISITGGTFVNFDPSANPEGAGTSYVADGYKVVSEAHGADTWYTVVKG